MILQKIYWHWIAIIKIVFYRIIFGGKLTFPFSSTFRERFNLAIVGGRIDIGENVFFNHDCSITCEGATIGIGDGTIFGEGVKVYCHNHKYKDTARPIKEQGYSCAPVSIGKHCWIGSNVVILKGVTIGDNSVIGAGCVIYKNVAANTVVVDKQELVMKQFKSMSIASFQRKNISVGGVILLIPSSYNKYLIGSEVGISTEMQHGSQKDYLSAA